MSRIRSLKPGFFRSESLARCTIPARVTFQGLWSEADDHGLGVANARVLAGVLWPHDDDIDHVAVEGHLEQLAATEHIELYVVNGKRYFRILKWAEHQSAALRRGEAQHPGPDQADRYAVRANPVGNTPPPGEACSLHDSARGGVRESAGGGGGGGGGGGTTRVASKRRLPDGWAPTPPGVVYATNRCLDVDAEVAAFTDYHQAKATTMADWNAAWRTWCRNAVTFAARAAPRGQPSKAQRNLAVIAATARSPESDPAFRANRAAIAEEFALGLRGEPIDTTGRSA
jgi:hypothetical protein